MNRTLRFRNLLAVALATLVALAPLPVAAQAPVVFYQKVDSIAGSATGVTGATSATCILTKFVGSAAGKQSVEVAAGGDITFKIAGVADATTGSPTLNGVFDLSTPAAAVDTMGELVTLINTTGSNWRAVLVSCLATDLTDNTIDTLALTDATGPKGVALVREATVASAAAVFTAQVALLPDDAAVNIGFFLSGGPVGSPTGSTKVNPNPFANTQTFVQHFRERITSAGTVAQLEVLAVKRTYSSTGQVAETVRVLHSEAGAATTVEKAVSIHAGPVVTAPGELVVVRQSTGTGLTVLSISGTAYSVRRQ